MLGQDTHRRTDIIAKDFRRWAGKNVVHWNVNIFGTGDKYGLDFRGGLYVNQPRPAEHGSDNALHQADWIFNCGMGCID